MTNEREAFKQLLEHYMEKLVPGEVYTVVASDEESQLKFEILTDSKRAMVAWAEISYALEEGLQDDVG